MTKKNIDFSGWATKNDLLCGDGRVIRKDAFIENDGTEVPLVWNHQHNDPECVLGHALLENRDDGVYAYCTFNDTEVGQNAKKRVQHGDVKSLSIYANKLKQVGNEVIHGSIKELSLVLAGANPGASIDFVMAHGDDGNEYISGFQACYDENIMIHYYEDGAATKKEDNKSTKKEDEKSNEKDDNKTGVSEYDTIEKVFNTLNNEQKDAVYAMLAYADEERGGNEMKHNVFEPDDKKQQQVLSHSDMAMIFTRAKQLGSLRDAVTEFADTLQHSGTAGEDYGIADIDYLFPDATLVDDEPQFIKRDTTWVSNVITRTKHTPLSRIKSIFADITEDEARAKGYIKGSLKKEEVFSLLKRTTTPTTVYKKQKLDRDDIVDIKDFNVVMWLKKEMRMMLDEEIARAILIGDGRLASSDDKINETNIRPVWTDDDLFTIKTVISVAANATDEEKAKAAIKGIIKSRKRYKGSGNPSLYTTEDFVTDCLLIENTIGERIYKTVDDLKTALRVSEIVTVEPMEGLTRTVDGVTRHLTGLILNPSDYMVGADKGGEVSTFEDFDIDYNQQKYLIETRCSGALTKPFSAIAVETVVGA